MVAATKKANSVNGAVRYFTVAKWALMSAAIFWMVVYNVSRAGVDLPDFVYVNF